MGSEIKYYRRFHGYDYSRGASLFITMATDPRRAVFGRVVNAKVERSLLGEKVFESLEAMKGRCVPKVGVFGGGQGENRAIRGLAGWFVKNRDKLSREDRDKRG